MSAKAVKKPVQLSENIALTASEDKFRFMFERSSVGKSFTLPSGAINVNQAFCNMLGYSQDELQNKSWQEITHPDDIALTQNALDQVLSGEQDAVRFEKRYLHKNGDVVWADVSTALLRGQRREPLYFMTDINDITARKQAESELLETQLLLTAVVESTDDFIWSVEPERFGLLTFNKRLSDNFLNARGIHVTTGMTPEDLYPTPDFVETWKTLYQRALLEGSYKTEYVGKTGPHTMELNFSLLKRDGAIFGISVFGRDITARKREEDARRESESTARALLDLPLTASFLINAQGTILDLNETMALRFGQTAAKLKGCNVYHLLPPEIASSRKAIVEEVIASGQMCRYEDERQGIWNDHVVNPILDEHGKVVKIVIAAHDITESKQAEAALRLRESYLTAILENQPGLVWLKDVEGRFLAVNQTFAKMCGIASPAELAGKTDLDLWPQELAEKYRADDASVLQNQAPQVVEEPIFDGHQTSWFETFKTPILDNQGAVIGTTGFSRNITERKQAEEKLRINEERLRMSLEAATDAIWDWDLATGETYFSPRWYEILGYKPHQIKTNSKEWVALAHPDDKEAALKTIYQAIADGSNYDIEFRSKHADGHWVWCHVKGKVTGCDATGKPSRMSGTNSDITLRKQAEEALRESELKYRSLIEASSDAIFCVDEKGQYQFANRLFATTLGRSPEDFIGKTFWDIYPKEHADYRFETTNRVFQTGESESIEIEVPLPDRTLFFYATANPIKDETGKVILVLTHTVNITARKQAEEALRESEKRLRLITDNMVDLIAQFDAQAFFQYVSPSYEKILGYRAEDLVGKSATDFLHPDERDKIIQAIDAMLRLGTGAVQFRYRHKNGSYRWIESTGRNLLNADGQVIGSTMGSRDITERKQAELKLKEYSEHLEELVEERTRELREAQETLIQQERLAVLGRLAGGVSQELRNPLGIINNSVYFLRMVQPDANEKVREYLSIIESEAHNADKIVSDLLDFSSNQLVVREPIVVFELVSEALQHVPAPENVQVTLNLPENLPTVYVDPLQMTQVLGNLVLNACQAMPKGGELVIRSEQRAESSEQKVESGQPPVETAPLLSTQPLSTPWILIAIKDTGSGIQAENMKKLFEPLFTTKPKGIGLGLAVSKKLVEANGGRIEVESEVGKGTTVTVWLPVHSVTARVE